MNDWSEGELFVVEVLSQGAHERPSGEEEALESTIGVARVAEIFETDGDVMLLRRAHWLWFAVAFRRCWNALIMVLVRRHVTAFIVMIRGRRLAPPGRKEELADDSAGVRRWSRGNWT